MLVLQATNDGMRRPGDKAINLKDIRFLYVSIGYLEAEMSRDRLS